MSDEQRNGNGNGTGSIARIQKLLEYHQECVVSLTRTLELLGGAAVQAKRQTGAGVVAQAIALDAQRRERAADEPSPRQQNKAAKIARREATAARLATFDRVTPRPGWQGVQTLTAGGYLARKGDGYVRTKKPFLVQKPDAKASSGPAVTAQRQRSATFLARFGATPIPAPPDANQHGFGILIAHGYLRRVDNGFVRTAKPFVVTKSASAAS